LMLRYPWPGNVRELRNAVEHAVVIARGPIAIAGDLPRKVRELEPRPPTPGPSPSTAPSDLRAEVQRFETQAILMALRQPTRNRTQAARLLQLPVRTLSNKIQQYGISKLGFGLKASDAPSPTPRPLRRERAVRRRASTRRRRGPRCRAGPGAGRP